MYRPVFEVLWCLHFKPSMDASSLRSDVISSMKIFSLLLASRMLSQTAQLGTFQTFFGTFCTCLVILNGNIGIFSRSAIETPILERQFTTPPPSRPVFYASRPISQRPPVAKSRIPCGSRGDPGSRRPRIFHIGVSGGARDDIAYLRTREFEPLSFEAN